LGFLSRFWISLVTKRPKTKNAIDARLKKTSSEQQLHQKPIHVLQLAKQKQPRPRQPREEGEGGAVFLTEDKNTFFCDEPRAQMARGIFFF
jgi:hypothetical protein